MINVSFQRQFQNRSNYRKDITFEIFKKIVKRHENYTEGNKGLKEKKQRARKILKRKNYKRQSRNLIKTAQN